MLNEEHNTNAFIIPQEEMLEILNIEITMDDVKTIVEEIPLEYWDDNSFIVEAVKKYRTFEKYLSETVNVPENQKMTFCSALVLENGEMFRYVPENLQAEIKKALEITYRRTVPHQ
jgi:hypothetical protein